MEKILLGCISDIHSPRFLSMFREALKKDYHRLESCDLILLAGDLINKGDISSLSEVIDPLEQLNIPLIAVFGNEEYDSLHEKIKSEVGNKIRYLDDESITLKIKNQEIGIIGSKGSLDRPTSWQQKNIPGIQEFYARRIKTIASLIQKTRAKIKILLLHYPPTYKTIVGERPSAYPYIGCRRMGRILKKNRVDAVIHGHAHLGIPFAYHYEIPVYNVSLPVRKSFTFVKVPLESSLAAFL
ncbi:MAG: metallophosphoesterase family protein [Candidatus Helarchaeales archaeon]